MIHSSSIVITCEHAVSFIPPQWQEHFLHDVDLINSHRGIDFGALEVAQHLSNFFNVPLFSANVSRLLIDCNRSLSHEFCFSELSKNLSHQDKQKIISTYYKPYRNKVYQTITKQIEENKPVLHLSIHSFTPELNGEVRNADLAFLYDPKRREEKRISVYWQKILKLQAPDLRVRRNYPYLGISDGFTTFLRKHFSADRYVGIELEINQNLTFNKHDINQMKAILANSLTALIVNQNISIDF